MPVQATLYNAGPWQKTGEITMTKTLSQVMPMEFSAGDYADVPARRYADIPVVREYDASRQGERWPGKHKNVYFWVTLSNGYAVGWNENPSRGWSFPVIRYTAV